MRCTHTTFILAAMVLTGTLAAEENATLAPWLGPQAWERLSAEPVLALGPAGAWDDTHVFAPCVAVEQGACTMWYCGSSNSVENRVFRLGRATSSDGIGFKKAPTPVYALPGGKRSILTPALLRGEDGRALREAGRLRMWFSCTDFQDPGKSHTLHESFSEDGKTWSPPSAAQLENVYAPSIIKDGGLYRMWYTDVSGDPWIIRHARSADGRHWEVAPAPCIVIDQPWETQRLFYPAVVKADGVYLMWYGAYWSDHPQKTALGFAVSLDGYSWKKHPQNPVFRPDPAHPWESHYTTSQTVMRLDDGTWQIWYASRKAPPFENKYFAIGAASWKGPAEK